MLRAVASGAGVALLGAGAAACREDDDPSAAGTTNPPPSGGKPAPLWTAGAVGGSIGNPRPLAVSGSTVVVCGDPLTGYDLNTGKQVWSHKGAAATSAEMLVNGNTLYVTSGEYDGSIVGLDPATGKKTWQSRLGSGYSVPKPIAVDDTHLYVIASVGNFGSDTNVIAAISIASGRIVWKEKRDKGTQPYGVIADVTGNRLAYTDDLKNVTVRDTATGHQVWTHHLGHYTFGGFGLDKSTVVVNDGTKLRAFALEDGKERWTVKTGDILSFNSPALLEGVVYAMDASHMLWAVDPETGRKTWSHDAGDTSYVQRFATSGDVVYGAADVGDKGGVLAFNAKDGSLLWSYQDDTGDDSDWHILVAGKKLLALHGKHLYAFPAA